MTQLRMMIGLFVIALFLGRPIARWAGRQSAKTRHPTFWYYTLGSMVLVFLLCLVTAYGCAPLTKNLYKEIPEELGAMAYTACGKDNKPFIVYDTLKIPKADMHWVRVHEMQHVKDMTPDCKSVFRRYATDGDFRLRMEYRAECAALKVAYKDPVTYEQAFNVTLAYYHESPKYPRLSIEESRKRFVDTCKEMPP